MKRVRTTGAFWRSNDPELKRLAGIGWRAREIAAKIGVSKAAVEGRAKRIKVTLGGDTNFWAGGRGDAAAKMFLAGQSHAEIAAQFKGATRASVSGVLKRRNVRRSPEAVAIASKIGRQRLNPPTTKRAAEVKTAIVEGVPIPAFERPKKIPANISARPKPLVQRGVFECAFVVSDEDAPPMMCCNAVAGGGSWCAEHRVFLLVPLTPKQKKMGVWAGRVAA